MKRIKLYNNVLRKQKGLKNQINRFMSTRWFIDEFIYGDGDKILSLDESIVLANLPIMHNDRYDQKVVTEYDKAIHGYKNWKDFCKRSMKYFNGSEIILDEKSILLSMFIRLFNELMNLDISKSSRYLSIFQDLSIGFRLYHMKNYSKSDLFNSLMKSSYYPSELSRLILILSNFKWHCNLLNEVINDDMSFRYYNLKNNYKLTENIICIK